MALRTPIIAIVGRPNVGKSTLFNAVLKERRALVEDIPGVTRDRNYALVEHYQFPFYLVDTGGFEKEATDELAIYVREQALLAAEEADVVLVVFDGKAGLQAGDEDVVEQLRHFSKPVFYLVNKCDGLELETLVSDFYAMGLEELFPLSALHGRRVPELIDRILKSIPKYESYCASAEALRERERELAEEVRQAIRNAELEASGAQVGEYLSDYDDSYEDEREDSDSERFGIEEFEQEEEFTPVFIPGESDTTAEEYRQSHRIVPLGNLASVAEIDEEELDEESEVRFEPIECIRIALVGRPNVGKSTLLNTLTGEQRAITSPIAGTTRDALHSTIRREGQEYLLVDTAGLRKKARISDRIERYSALRSLRAITECDVAVVLLDATEGPSEQDAKIVGLAHEEGKGIVIVVNKWDLIEKDHRSVQEFKQNIKDAFRFSPYAPVIFASALSGRRCPKIIDAVKEVAYQRTQMVPTNKLNRVLQRAMLRNSPPVARGRRVRLYYAAQIASQPPRFILFFNHPEAVHFSYLRYLKNAIREQWKFEGTDLKMVCRKRKNPQRQHPTKGQ